MGTLRGAHSALGTDVKDRRTVANQARRRELTRLHLSMNRRGALLMAGLVVLMAVSGWSVGPARAAPHPARDSGVPTPHLVATMGIRASEQYVFSMGVVDRMSADALTLRFGDGETETYALDGATTIQTQNGDALDLADLAVGDMVIVLTVENDRTAVTIVSGGEEGFHDAGPGDIRGHDEDECGSCDAHAP